MDREGLLAAADRLVVDRPRRVVVAFLVATALFAAGLGNVSTEAGTEQFAEDVPEQEALTAVNEEFDPPFEPAPGTTQVIQTGENVLSKPGLARMLEFRERVEERTGLRVTGFSSVAGTVARVLAPEAETTEELQRAVRRASPGQVDAAVRTADARSPGFASLLSEDYNPRAASASATVAVVEHDVPGGVDETAGAGGTSPLTPIQLEMRRIASAVGGDVRVFGAGILAAEFANVIGDTLLVVVPAAVVLILLFLVVAYRDAVDLLLGVVSLSMTVVWTFGFMGLAGIAFNQILIAVPPLLLAVGIDFGIHAINRYREERVADREASADLPSEGADDHSPTGRADDRSPSEGTDDRSSTGGADDPVGRSMRVATDQLLVAFAVVTATSVIGFGSNLASGLLPIRDFGLVAAIGIVFTFLVFGVFLPAAKVLVDRFLARHPLPTGSSTPLGAEGSALGEALAGGVVVARRAPVAVVLVALLATAGAAGYATGLDTAFSEEDFLPPEETPAYLAALPEPFRPDEYTVTRDIEFLEENFETGEEETVTIYLQGPMQRDTALESIHRAGRNPPATFVTEEGRAVSRSVVTVVRELAGTDPEFRALVARNDRDGDGIPDDDLPATYDALLSSPAREEALRYLAEDRRSARVVYSVEADAPQAAVAADAREMADRFRVEATATGNIVVFQAIADLILRSALVTLAIALSGTVVFLVVAYWLLAGRPSLGVANAVPIVVTVALVAGSMRVAGIALNAFTATVLAITIGLGIDYSVHVVHRFLDEYEARGDAVAALAPTVAGTGGALTGSVLTTAFGIGVLVLSVFPAIGQFGLLTALSVVYAYLASLLVLPSVLVVWARLVERRESTGPPE